MGCHRLRRSHNDLRRQQLLSQRDEVPPQSKSIRVTASLQSDAGNPGCPKSLVGQWRAKQGGGDVALSSEHFSQPAARILFEGDVSQYSAPVATLSAKQKPVEDKLPCDVIFTKSSLPLA